MHSLPILVAVLAVPVLVYLIWRARQAPAAWRKDQQPVVREQYPDFPIVLIWLGSLLFPIPIVGGLGGLFWIAGAVDLVHRSLLIGRADSASAAAGRWGTAALTVGSIACAGAFVVVRLGVAWGCIWCGASVLLTGYGFHLKERSERLVRHTIPFLVFFSISVILGIAGYGYRYLSS